MKIEKPTALLTGLMILVPVASSYCYAPPFTPTTNREALFISLPANSKTLGCVSIANQQEDPPGRDYQTNKWWGTNNYVGTASLPSNASLPHFTLGTAQFTLNAA